MEKNEHISVLLNEVTDTLKNKVERDGLIVDCTLGRGGHFFALLKYFNNMLGLDADTDSINYVSLKLKKLGYKNTNNVFVNGNKKVLIYNQNFNKLTNILSELNTNPSAVLLDLGISTYQLKKSGRGFSFNFVSEPLDMRIDTVNCKVTASDLVNGLTKKDLQDLFFNFGGETKSKYFANLICLYREKNKIVTVGDFLKAIKIDSSQKYKKHPATKIFMALRIAVNLENVNLKKILADLKKYIDMGVKVLIITFHSLEAKTVKVYCKQNNYKLTKFYPSRDEILNNKSSRSAILNFIKND